MNFVHIKFKLLAGEGKSASNVPDSLSLLTATDSDTLKISQDNVQKSGAF